MQWHWGNIGSALAGLSTLVVAAAILIRGPAALKVWMERQRAEAAAAREQAENLALDRRRHLHGWSRGGIHTFGVTLVTGNDELTHAANSLAGGHPSEYVVLRVSEGEQTNLNRAHTLRQIIKNEGVISRPPTAGEREALEIGLDSMGIPQAAHRSAQPGS